MCSWLIKVVPVISKDSFPGQEGGEKTWGSGQPRPDWKIAVKRKMLRGSGLFV